MDIMGNGFHAKIKIDTNFGTILMLGEYFVVFFVWDRNEKKGGGNFWFFKRKRDKDHGKQL